MTDAALTLKFGADTSALNAGLSNAASSINSFGSQIYGAFANAGTATTSLTQRMGSFASEAASSLGRLVTSAHHTATGMQGAASVAVRTVGGVAAASAAAASLAAAALGVVAAQSVQFGMAVGNSAAQLGDTTENISQLVPVADAAGLSLDALTTKFTAMGAKLDANDKTFKNALKALKINPATFNAAGALDQMNMMQTAVSHLGESYNKSAALQVLFGTSATQMDAVLSRSSSSFRMLEQQAQRTGTVMSGSLVDGMRGTQSIVQQISDRFNEAKQATLGLALTIYGQLKPAIDGILQDFSATVSSIVDFIEQTNSATQKGEGLTGALRSIKGALFEVAFGLRMVRAEFSKWGEDLGTFSTTLDKVTNMATKFWHDLHSGGDISGKGADALRNLTTQAGTDMQTLSANMHDRAAKIRADLEKQWSKPITQPQVGAKSNAGAMPTGDNGAAIRNEQAKIEGQIAVLRAGLEQKKVIYAQEVAVGRMDQNQLVAAAATAMEEEYQAELKLLQKEAAIGGMKVAQKQQILNKIATLQVTHDTQMIAESTRSAAKMYENYKRAYEEIGNSVSQGIMGMITRTESLRQVARNMLLGMIQDFVSTTVKIVADWAAKTATQAALTIASQGVQTSAVTAGVAARTAAEGAGASGSLAISAATMIETIIADSKAAFAGVFGFLAPVMGPAAAGPAAAAMGVVGGMASFAVGSWQLPSDMVAQVHQGEMIVPAQHASWAQSLMSNAASGGGGAGGATHYHMAATNHFHGVGGNPDDIAEMVQKSMKDLARRPGAMAGLRTRR